VEILPLNWYVESPIDFEYKQYILFAYLQNVEVSFLNRVLSPHLLHMEKMVIELNNFNDSFEMIRKDFEKHRYIYMDINKKLEGEFDETIIQIKDIVEFSIPQFESRIKMGYRVFEKYKQILF
jgi:hypothetical protein